MKIMEMKIWWDCLKNEFNNTQGGEDFDPQMLVRRVNRRKNKLNTLSQNDANSVQIYDKILNTKASLNDLGSRGNQILDKALELKESSLKDRGVGSGKGVVPTTKYWHVRSFDHKGSSKAQKKYDISKKSTPNIKLRVMKKNLSHATRNKSYDDRSKDILQGKPSPSLGQVFSPHVSKVVKPTKEDLQEHKRKGNEILHLMRIMEKK